ncbi:MULTISPECIES: hypothetical protein [unclassified Bradyrhizobium]|uniref:hypothetical protein n=1 Tax=unclassified Bradyrhizobium TaxID=2631580 RepID=UPI00211EAB1E|nr:MULTISPECIES: hypothetical protein [unclassified Bradyrhizobium]
MKFIESIVAKFGPDRINNLSSQERLRLLEARRHIQHGWLSGTDQARLKIAGISASVIADLNSSQAPRHRAALGDPALQAYVRAEIQRWISLRLLAYFQRKLESFDDFSLAKAEAVLKDEGSFCFSPGFVDDTDFGRSFRRGVLFVGTNDENVLFVIAHFLKLFVSTLRSLMHRYEAFGINDQQLRQELLKSLPNVTATFTDSALRRFQEAMERAAGCEEPKAICPYFDILRAPGLQDELVSAQLERKRAVAAERAAVDAENDKKAAADAVRAEEERKRLAEAQLTLEIVDGSLDVTPSSWPLLETDAKLQELLENMRTGFAQARKVHCDGAPLEKEFRNGRSIVSMSAKQLALVKIEFWKSRSGVFRGVTNPAFMTNRMIGLLNCEHKLDPNDTKFQHFPELYAGGAIELEAEWRDNLDFLQKWIDDEGFKGELVRWFVEDKDNDDGWATSR